MLWYDQGFFLSFQKLEAGWWERTKYIDIYILIPTSQNVTNKLNISARKMLFLVATAMWIRWWWVESCPFITSIFFLLWFLLCFFHRTRMSLSSPCCVNKWILIQLFAHTIEKCCSWAARWLFSTVEAQAFASRDQNPRYTTERGSDCTTKNSSQTKLVSWENPLSTLVFLFVYFISFFPSSPPLPLHHSSTQSFQNTPPPRWKRQY